MRRNNMDKKPYLKQVVIFIISLILSTIVWGLMSQDTGTDTEGVPVLKLFLYAIIGLPLVVINFRLIKPQQKPSVSGIISCLSLIPWIIAVSQPGISIVPFGWWFTYEVIGAWIIDVVAILFIFFISGFLFNINQNKKTPTLVSSIVATLTLLGFYIISTSIFAIIS